MYEVIAGTSLNAYSVHFIHNFGAVSEIRVLNLGLEINVYMICLHK